MGIKKKGKWTRDIRESNEMKGERRREVQEKHFFFKLKKLRQLSKR